MDMHILFVPIIWPNKGVILVKENINMLHAR